jgi:hypothetical protein
MNKLTALHHKLCEEDPEYLKYVTAKTTVRRSKARCYLIHTTLPRYCVAPMPASAR